MRWIPGKAGPGDLKGYPTLPPTSPSQKPGPCVEASALAPCGSISHPALGSFYPGNYRGSRAWIWVATARKPQPEDPAQAHTLSDQALPVLQEQAHQLLCPLFRASVAGLKSCLASHHTSIGYLLDSHMDGEPASLTLFCKLISGQSRVIFFLAGTMLVRSPSLESRPLQPHPEKTSSFSRDLPQTSNSPKMPLLSKLLPGWVGPVTGLWFYSVIWGCLSWNQT